MTWDHLGLPAPTQVQEDLADYLQHGPERQVIMAFRGVGKSWITSAFACWLLLRNPQLNILVTSASKDRSDQFTTFTRRLIDEMPILRHLAPKPGQRDSKLQFDVGPAEADHSPSVKSCGLFGQMTGSRADHIISDDVEVPNNTETVTARTKLSERVKEYDAILKPGGRITFLGTPHTEESLYNELPERGYETRIWTARVPSQEQRETYGDRLAPMVQAMCDRLPEGTPVDPLRFDDEDLVKRAVSLGRSSFALQYMLDTTLSDADRYPLKLSDLIVTDVDPEVAPEKMIWCNDPTKRWQDLPLVGFNGDYYHRPMSLLTDPTGVVLMRKYTGSVMCIDPSGRGQDETGVAVGKALKSQIFIPFAGRVKGGYSPEALTKIAELAKEHKVNKVVIESNFGDGMFAELLKPYLTRIYPVSVEEVNSTGQKEKRIIDVMEPVMNQHRLIIDRKVIQHDYADVKDYPEEKKRLYRLFYQLTHLTKDRGSLAHDDRLEALAMVVSYFVKAMAQDAESDLEDWHEKQRQKRLEEFIKKFHRIHPGRYKKKKRKGWVG